MSKKKALVAFGVASALVAIFIMTATKPCELETTVLVVEGTTSQDRLDPQNARAGAYFGGGTCMTGYTDATGDTRTPR